MKNNFTLGHLYRKIKSFLVQLNGWKIIWTGNMIRQINLFLVHRCSDRYWLLITAVTYYMLDSSSEWTCNLAFVFTSSVFTFMWSDLISWNLLSLIRCLIRWPLSTWNLCFLFSFIDQRAYREPAAALPDTYPVCSINWLVLEVSLFTHALWLDLSCPPHVGYITLTNWHDALFTRKWNNLMSNIYWIYKKAQIWICHLQCFTKRFIVFVFLRGTEDFPHKEANICLLS